MKIPDKTGMMYVRNTLMREQKKRCRNLFDHPQRISQSSYIVLIRNVNRNQKDRSDILVIVINRCSVGEKIFCDTVFILFLLQNHTGRSFEIF